MSVPARVGQRIVAILILAIINVARLNNAVYNRNRAIASRAMARVYTRAMAATDIIIRPCPPVATTRPLVMAMESNQKPQLPPIPAGIPSALSRNISAFDADSCAAVIADARPSITTLCDKASVSANGQWNGCCVVFAAVHPRRKNSRIVYARGELIRPNENQRGRPGIAEIQRTVALFLFAFRVNRQVFNRQRRNERVANLHPKSLLFAVPLSV